MCLSVILIYSFDNDDMKSSKRHVILPSVIFLLKCPKFNIIITGLPYMAIQSKNALDFSVFFFLCRKTEKLQNIGSFLSLPWSV